MAYALGLKGTLSNMAMRIKGGKIREYDLIHCDEKRRAFMSSIGLEGSVLRLRDQYLAKGTAGFKVYLRAVLKAYFREYKRLLAEITVDGVTCTVRNLLTLMIFKQPYYGYGIKVVPAARFDDALLHILSINSGLLGSTIGVVTSLTIGNCVGQYRTGREMAVKLERPVMLQLDGNMGWEAEAFNFRVLPKAMRIKC
jgi:diacylglycerol kinase family enzyme